MRLELNLRMSQTVTPQMILSMTMLQYSSGELEEYLETMACENPMMDVKKSEPEDSAKVFAEQLAWIRGSDRQNRSYYQETEDFSPEGHREQGETLSSYLREQIITMDISRELRRCMEVIVELLTPRGFFDGSIQEVARLAGSSEKLAEEGLERLKELEPAGVGAGGFRECMLLQLDRLPGDHEIARRMVEEHFEHLATWPSQRIATALGVDRRSVERGRDLILSLKPFPGDGFSTNEEIQYIRPDLYIFEQDGILSVSSSEETVPRVSVNGEYLKMLETEQDPEVQRYLRQKLSQLEQIMKNLGNRKSTMEQCGQIIARRQAAFFQGGSLVKMTLRDVAEEMGVHESTISRTVRGKYIQCRRGIFEMAYFFSRDAGQNIGVSRNHIKDRLRQVISEEDPAKPLSDEKLVEVLARENLLVSRRTVAKYRMELGIMAASGRKARNSDR